MSIFQTIHERRSIKAFTARTVMREEIEQLLESVVQAPNHRMTEPWRFYVLGPKLVMRTVLLWVDERRRE